MLSSKFCIDSEGINFEPGQTPGSLLINWKGNGGSKGLIDNTRGGIIYDGVDSPKGRLGFRDKSNDCGAGCRYPRPGTIRLPLSPGPTPVPKKKNKQPDAARDLKIAELALTGQQLAR